MGSKYATFHRMVRESWAPSHITTWVQGGRYYAAFEGSGSAVSVSAAHFDKLPDDESRAETVCRLLSGFGEKSFGEKSDQRHSAPGPEETANTLANRIESLLSHGDVSYDEIYAAAMDVLAPGDEEQLISGGSRRGKAGVDPASGDSITVNVTGADFSGADSGVRVSETEARINFKGCKFDCSWGCGLSPQARKLRLRIAKSRTPLISSPQPSTIPAHPLGTRWACSASMARSNSMQTLVSCHLSPSITPSQPGIPRHSLRVTYHDLRLRSCLP